MTPPFIAYYGALYQPYVNSWILYQSYDQIRLYRNYLFDPAVGLWRHVVLGSWQDYGHWSTGNGWAAAGIIRVLATINQTTLGYQPQFISAQRDLQNWATEIVNNIWVYQVRSFSAAIATLTDDASQQSSGALLNYADDAATFPDSSSTALLAYVTYRLATISSWLRGPNSQSTTDPTITDTQPAFDYSTLPALIQLNGASLQAAHKARDYIRNNVNTTDGWLGGVVDPYTFGSQGTQSPEGQSFLLLMEAAWRDWRDSISD